MYCSSCGTQIEDGNRFCPECGARVSMVHGIQPQVSQNQQMQPRIIQTQPMPAGKIKLKKKKKWPFILLIVLILIIAMVVGFLGFGMYRKSYVGKQLELAQNYLLDQNYEEAIVALTNALKYEPKDSETYDRLVDAYLEWADYVIDTKQDYEEAIDILQRGKEQTGDDRIAEKLREYEDYNEMQGNLTGILDHIAALCNDGDFDAVFTYMQSDEYAYLIRNVKGLKDDFIADTAYGRVGIYRIKESKYGNYMLYYGDFEKKKESYIRHGVGVWLGYYDGNNCLVTGEWKNDKPNGKQVMREWNSSLASDVISRVVQGNVKDGLWDGAVKWSLERNSGETDVFDVTFQDGVALILYPSEKNKNRYVIGTNTAGTGMELSIDDPNDVFSITGF